jgi:RND family efflux transporter MFP subunit
MRGAYILVCAMLLAGCGEQENEQAEAAPRPLQVFEVADAEMIAGRALPGQARSAREAILSFRVGGRVLDRRPKPGDKISEGEVLATLDQASYRTALDQADANLERARAAYANFASQVERDRQLLSKGTIPKARFESSDADAKQALAEVKSLEAAQARAKLDLSYTELRAPFSGVVSAVFAQAFEEVKPQEPVMRVIDPAEIEMVVNVPESLISIVPHVVDLTATFDAFPTVQIPAEVSEIGSEPSDTTRTYPVKVLLSPPQGITILPGMAGRLRGKRGPEIARLFKGVVVPLSAVFSPDDTTGSFVWLVDQTTNTVHRQRVTLGEPVVGGVNVTEGLDPGATIAAAGVHSLHEGQKVRVLQPEMAMAP